MLATLAALLLSAAPVTADADPEPPTSRVKSLEKIAKKMDDLAVRLKHGSADAQTRRLQKQVLEHLEKAISQEKAKATKAPKGQSTDVIADLTKVRATQARLGKALEALGNAKNPETKAKFSNLRDQQVRVAQILHNTAARLKAAR